MASNPNMKASGEEEVGRSNPGKDLIASAVIAVLSLLTMLLALRLPAPGDVSTAPGLLPFVTGLTGHA